MSRTLWRTLLFLCFTFHYVLIELNCLFLVILEIFSYIICDSITFLLYCKFIIFQMQVVFWRVLILLCCICFICLKCIIALRDSNVFYDMTLLMDWICCNFALEGPYYFVLIIYFAVLYFYQNTSFSDL